MVLDMSVPQDLKKVKEVPDETWRRVPEEKAEMSPREHFHWKLPFVNITVQQQQKQHTQWKDFILLFF